MIAELNYYKYWDDGKDSWKYGEYNIKKFDKCAHLGCPECHGSGRKKNGELCIHMLSCRCPKCNFQ